ncbi:hypothetical protein R5R73_10215 [Salinicola sp. LHM]|uniref:hypothetical protein n=1 Tax=Salinicola sp. LHM TaxID=3065298 RepID=UPI002ACE4594|nr:hypothetical protein [Salinicola sp. LHM]WQH31456.1 hypothetical protein R5R73_10215 [Salinicola sp. LHM]
MPALPAFHFSAYYGRHTCTLAECAKPASGQFCFVGIPKFLVLIVIAANVPLLLFSARFFGGVAAAKVKRYLLLRWRL